MGEFVGSIVTVDCGDVGGTYQGQVASVDQHSQALVIVKAFHNGIRCRSPSVTIVAASIEELRILHSAAEARQMNTVVNWHLKPLQDDSTTNGKAKTTVHNSNSDCSRPQPNVAATSASPVKQSDTNANLVNNHNNSVSAVVRNGHKVSSNGTGKRPGIRSKESLKAGGGGQPVSGYKSDGSKQLQNAMRDSPKCNASASCPKLFKDDQSMLLRQRTTSASDLCGAQRGSCQKDRLGRSVVTDCYVEDPDGSDDAEFDFEKNLALFDKQAVFEEIDKLGVGGKGDGDGKYRCDENVLQGVAAVYSQIKLCDTAANGDMTRQYVTDTGLVVPAVSTALRDRLFSAAERCGYGRERRVEMIGRSTAEMVLQLLGGVNRFNPKNMHQCPVVVVMCGNSADSAAGINCARHLVGRSVKVTTLMPPTLTPTVSRSIEMEMRLFELSDGRKVTNCKDLPHTTVDMIITALDCHDTSPLAAREAWYQSAVEWANQKKAPVLAIDPPVTGSGITTKWSLGVVLPLALDARCGQVYLGDLGIPNAVFREVGITYRSPFAHKFVIPLHSS